MMLNDGNYDENENFKKVNVMCKDELGTPLPPPPPSKCSQTQLDRVQ